jgi:hypothetical protein
MDMEDSDRLSGSETNHGISPGSDQSRHGVRLGEPQAAPPALTRGQRRIESAPELQVACGGNSIWLGVGGGVFSTLTSVSPALSYYIGGTMIWAVAQTIRLLSDAPAAPSSSSSPSSNSRPRGNPDVRSTYAYTVLPALTVSADPVSAGCALPSPSMALLLLVLRDLLSKGKYHCCAVLMASLLAASSSAVFKDLLRARLLQLYLSQGAESRGARVSEEESTLAGSRTATAVASAFKLSKLISPKGRERDRARESDSLSAKLSQALLPPYMRVKCEREMTAIEQPFSTLSKEGSDSCTTLVATDVISSILSEAQALRCSSRAVFHSAAEITAQAIREQGTLPSSLPLEDTDISQQRVRSVSVLLTTLTAAPSLAPSPTIKGQVQPAVRILPDATRAVCNIDTGGLMTGHSHDMTASRKNPAEERGAGTGTGTGAASNPTIRVMLCSVCIAMLLTGDAEGAGAVASLLLDRPDIRAVCSVLSYSNSNSSITQAAPAQSSPSSGAVTSGDQLEHVSEMERRREAVAAAVNSALSFFGGNSA